MNNNTIETSDIGINNENLYNLIKKLESANESLSSVTSLSLSSDLISGLPSASSVSGNLSKLKKLLSSGECSVQEILSKANTIKKRLCELDSESALYFNYMDTLDDEFSPDYETIDSIESIEVRMEIYKTLENGYREYIEKMRTELALVEEQIFSKQLEYAPIDNIYVPKLSELNEQKETLETVIFIYQRLANNVIDKRYKLYLEYPDFYDNIDSRIVGYEQIAGTVSKGILGLDDRYFYANYIDKSGNKINVTAMEIAMYLSSNGMIVSDIYGNIIVNNITNYLNNFLPYMDTDEKNILAYIYNTQGTEAAQEYIDFKWDKVNMNHGLQEADRVVQRCLNHPNNISRILIEEGFKDGLNQFFNGIENLISADGKMSDEDYKSLFLLQFINTYYSGNNLNDKINSIVSTGSYKISASIGNVLPSIAIGAISTFAGAPAWLGTLSMGLSTTGNAREQGLRLEKSETAAWMYGILVGASDAIIEWFLGGLPVLKSEFAPSTAKLFIKECLKETEKGIAQEILDVIFNNLTGTKTELDLAEVGETGIYSFITAGILNGGQVIINGIQYNLYQAPELFERLINVQGNYRDISQILNDYGFVLG